MTSKEMLRTYGEQYVDRTFEKMYLHTIKLDKIDPLTFKYLPFLKDKAWLTEDAYCIFEQCIAIEKGWA